MTGQGVAVVTGGAGGIGRAVGAALAARGMAVALVDRNGEGAVKAAAALGAGGAGAGARGYAADISRAAEVATLFERVAAELGTPTVLVNNAGAFPSDPFLDMTEESWRHVLDVNLTGPFLCAQAFARARVAAGGGGTIVNVASTAAFSARVAAAHYSASKAGLVMLTRSLALELGPHRIRVNAIAPSLTDVGDGRHSADYVSAFLRMVPYGRLGRPEDMARAVAFLASDDSDFITGTVLPVDGGFLTGRSLPRTRAD